MLVDIINKEGSMKRVVLLLPDTINRTLGGSRWSKTDEADFTEKNLLSVLCDRSNYHDHWSFSPEDVQILSIEDVD
jgi:hypothetical protein